MYENQWTLSTDNLDWVNKPDLPHVPVLKITFDGSSSECREYLSDISLVRQIPSTVDVTFRLHEDQTNKLTKHDVPTLDGTLGVANSRGEYIVECVGQTRQILDIVSVANRYGDRLNDTGMYELRLEASDEIVERWTAFALIFFTPDGKIRRRQSLIPPGLDI